MVLRDRLRSLRAGLGADSRRSLIEFGLEVARAEAGEGVWTAHEDTHGPRIASDWTVSLDWPGTFLLTGS